MEESHSVFSEKSQEKIAAWREHALEQDKNVKPHMLIFVNDEGYQERAPGPSEFVAQWVEDYSNRKDIYEREELIEWLKKERERELRHLKNAENNNQKIYFKLFLKVLAIEISELADEESQKDQLNQAESFLKEGELEKSLEELDQFLRDKEEFEEEQTEVILIQSRLHELEKMYAENLILIQDYLQQNAQIRKSILLLLKGL